MNNNGYMYHNRPMRPQNRQFFFPFLTGALVGGAAVGLTRPRPIYNVAPYPVYGPGPGPYYPRPYSYYSYGGYGY